MKNVSYRGARAVTRLVLSAAVGFEVHQPVGSIRYWTVLWRKFFLARILTVF